MARWLDRAGLELSEQRPLAGNPLTVLVWSVTKPAVGKAAAGKSVKESPIREIANG